ncbi:galactosyltransferase-related protein [Streptomyces abyssomicinicus]|uniref:galactosyltransferase-related protein n=1 Tax=Streptomyces abyssomicinicus TaxID=574929 RepID=UPI00125008E9|nr:galactosyltransferase-related protein [Streptomyces abyssomicinicus]
MTEPAVAQPPAVAQSPGTTARTAVGVYVAACDPEAAVNASTWRETEPAHHAVRAALLSRAWADKTVPEVLRRLAADPADATAHRFLEAALEAELAHDGAFAARLAEMAAEAERTTVIRYHLGAAYRRPAEDEPPVPGSAEEVRALIGAEPVARAGAGDPLVAVVIPVRAHPSDTGRARNAVAAVASAVRQDLDRSAYRVVVVEQDVEPRMDRYLADLVDDYLFLPNPGAFNKSWALNAGVAAVPGARHLCFHDADMVVERDHLSKVVACLEDGPPALLPYGDLVFLDPASSGRAIRSRLAPGGSGTADASRLRGFALRDVWGGYVCVTRDLFETVGGYDERFRGWGDEDNEFYRQVLRHTSVPRWSRPLAHLWHRRPVMVDAEGRRANQHIARTPRPANPGPLGDPRKYAHEMTHGTRTETA